MGVAADYLSAFELTRWIEYEDRSKDYDFPKLN